MHAAGKAAKVTGVVSTNTVSYFHGESTKTLYAETFTRKTWRACQVKQSSAFNSLFSLDLGEHYTSCPC